MKKCIYCGKEIEDTRVIDFCDFCGVGVFGEKMLKAIVQNMENAREKGDLNQGSVTDNLTYKEDNFLNKKDSNSIDKL